MGGPTEEDRILAAALRRVVADLDRERGNLAEDALHSAVYDHLSAAMQDLNHAVDLLLSAE